MEEYDYDIQYVKGKENEVADCLFRLCHTTSDTLKQATWEVGLSEENESTENMTPEKPDTHTKFISWRLQPTFGKVETKPNVIGKLWKQIKNEGMPDYDEED